MIGMLDILATLSVQHRKLSRAVGLFEAARVVCICAVITEAGSQYVLRQDVWGVRVFSAHLDEECKGARVMELNGKMRLRITLAGMDGDRQRSLTTSPVREVRFY